MQLELAVGWVIVMAAVFPVILVHFHPRSSPGRGQAQATMLSGLSKGKGVVKGSGAPGDRGSPWDRMVGMATG